LKGFVCHINNEFKDNLKEIKEQLDSWLEEVVEERNISNKMFEENVMKMEEFCDVVSTDHHSINNKVFEILNLYLTSLKSKAIIISPLKKDGVKSDKKSGVVSDNTIAVNRPPLKMTIAKNQDKLIAITSAGKDKKDEQKSKVIVKNVKKVDSTPSSSRPSNIVAGTRLLTSEQMKAQSIDLSDYNKTSQLLDFQKYWSESKLKAFKNWNYNNNNLLDFIIEYDKECECFFCLL